MMIDWLTLELPEAWFPQDVLQALRLQGDRIMRYDPKTGTVVWETVAWDSVRSDSHQLVAKLFSTGLRIQGSPARVMGDGDNVFGLDGSSLDIQVCARSMVRFVSDRLTVELGLPVDLPTTPWSLWKCSRVDITQNYFLKTAADVRVALSQLGGVSGGRYKVTQTKGETCYWNHRSQIRSGKAYAKGPELRAKQKRKDYNGRRYDGDELGWSERILRLEVAYRHKYWRERSSKRWEEHTSTDLEGMWSSYFDRMIGELEIEETNVDLKTRVEEAAATPGQAKAAWMMLSHIKTHGLERTQEEVARRTYYRNMKILRAAGLTDMELSAKGTVVPFTRKRTIECVPVNSWADVRRYA